jgi:hypothetical protein
MVRIRYKEAVGIEVRQGRPSIGARPPKADLVGLYVQEGKSIREVAETLCILKDMVSRALKEYGIEARPNVKRSQLKEYGIRTLMAGIREKGVRGYAKEIGIHENTLRHYLRGTKQ